MHLIPGKLYYSKYTPHRRDYALTPNGDFKKVNIGDILLFIEAFPSVDKVMCYRYINCWFLDQDGDKINYRLETTMRNDQEEQELLKENFESIEEIII